MSDRYVLKECATPGCGWIFVAQGSGGLSQHCNEHSRTSNWQPRICKVGAEETDWETLVGLAMFVVERMGWDAGSQLSKSLSAIVRADLRAFLERRYGG